MVRLRHAAASVAVIGLLSLASTALAKPRLTEARTDTGRVAGTVDADTLVFKGIPFAAPPVGPLRWRPPAAPVAWRGVRDASRFGAACPQPSDHKEAWAQVGAQSEDCLFLNVWRPARPGHYPVMVFLHGGAFTYGAAGVPLYDGRRLAERGAIVVTVNYRLGRLGFFAHPALSRERPDGRVGNYGIMDQIAALQWVRRNIANFGGDAKNVTLFGESAGAGSVQILMASPAASGLFQKAISESGAGNTVLAPLSGGDASAEASGRRWADGLGLADATADQLRAIPLTDVVKGRSFPFIDGKVVVWSPGDAFRLGREMRIPLMIGSNSNEGSLLGNNVGLAKLVLGDDYAALLARYAARPDSPPSDAALDLLEDAGLVLPSLWVGRTHVSNGATSYAFYFNQVPASARAGTLGAPHGGEVEYLFGTKPADERWDASDEAVSRLMGDYWVRFARTGNPNGNGAPVWPAMSASRPPYLSIEATTHAITLTPLQATVEALVMRKATDQWIKNASQ